MTAPNIEVAAIGLLLVFVLPIIGLAVMEIDERVFGSRRVRRETRANYRKMPGSSIGGEDG